MWRRSLYGAIGARGAGAAAFSPLSLSPTAWYDPSDLTTLFQDAAMTTPVTADGDVVGAMMDKSGNANHMTQGTTASKPLYRTGSGKPYLEFDAVDDELTATFALTGQAYSCVMAYTYAATDFMILHEASPATSPWTALGTDGNGSLLHESTSHTLQAIYTDNTLQAITTRDQFHDAVQLATRVQVDVTSDGAPAYTTPSIGRYATGTRSVPGPVYGLFIRITQLNATERGDLDTWLAAKVP